MADLQGSVGDSGQPPELGEIAKWVLGISGLAIFGIATASLIGAAFAGSEQFVDTSQLVFNALLPLLGTWVGTVLAYYFSRKNFESASQSVERMVTLTTEQRLGQMLVEKEMLRPSDITLIEVPAGGTAADVLLKDVRAKLGGRITRVPITTSSGAILYVVHQSGLYRFLAEQALAGKSQADIEKLTLQDLADDAVMKTWVTNIAFVPQTASVADAKRIMEQQPAARTWSSRRPATRPSPCWAG